MARSGVAGDVKAGAQVFGSPAKDKKTAYKEQIALSKLPELLKKWSFWKKKFRHLNKQPISVQMASNFARQLKNSVR